MARKRGRGRVGRGPPGGARAVANANGPRYPGANASRGHHRADGPHEREHGASRRAVGWGPVNGGRCRGGPARGTPGSTVQDTPPATPWASIGLLVLGLVLFYAAARIDTTVGLRGRVSRALITVLFLLSGATLAAAVVVGVLG